MYVRCDPHIPVVKTKQYVPVHVKEHSEQVMLHLTKYLLLNRECIELLKVSQVWNLALLVNARFSLALHFLYQFHSSIYSTETNRR